MADLTSAAAGSAAASVGAVAAAELLKAMFGIPLDALGCGLAGAYIGLHFVNEPMSTARALRLFVGLGLGAAIVGNWASEDERLRELVALGVGIIGVPGTRIAIAHAAEGITFLANLLKGRRP